MQTTFTGVDESALEYAKSLTLLCVEDNKSTQLIYAAIFEDHIQKIIFADNGKEGYEKFLDNEIDIIISDYDMPIMNGLDMIKNIREESQDIPIILVSAIEDIDVIVKALQLNVNNFIKKPIQSHEVLESVTNVSKLLIANQYLEEQRNKKLKELEAKDQYSNYQEDLAFSKELNILRNDLYYKMITSRYMTLIDFLYQPLDILSGDAYSAREIDQNTTFYILVDGMGKGLSASLSAMIITSFINYLIDTMKLNNNFDFDKVINDSMNYIKPILLEEEALAIEYITIDCEENIIKYAKFAMPVTLLEDNNNNIIRLRSNNAPLSKYTRDFEISTYDISNISKFLFYSDGIVENPTKYNDVPYAQYIEEDFKNSFTKEGFKDKLFDKITDQEDDITLMFINRLDFHDTKVVKNTFKTSLDEVDNANEWYATFWEGLTKNTKTIYNASVVFTELFMNAYEHGNLGIDLNYKNQLLENDIYFDTLLEKQADCKKMINVEVRKIVYEYATYVITQITDEGDGFDTQILSSIFRNSHSFNGRGVFVSKQSSLGIYYNSKGNSVLYLHKI